jgi:hypothetical protein
VLSDNLGPKGQGDMITLKEVAPPGDGKTTVDNLHGGLAWAADPWGDLIEKAINHWGGPDERHEIWPFPSEDRNAFEKRKRSVEYHMNHPILQPPRGTTMRSHLAQIAGVSERMIMKAQAIIRRNPDFVPKWTDGRIVPAIAICKIAKIARAR